MVLPSAGFSQQIQQRTEAHPYVINPYVITNNPEVDHHSLCMNLIGTYLISMGTVVSLSEAKGRVESNESKGAMQSSIEEHKKTADKMKEQMPKYKCSLAELQSIKVLEGILN